MSKTQEQKQVVARHKRVVNVVPSVEKADRKCARRR